MAASHNVCDFIVEFGFHHSSLSCFSSMPILVFLGLSVFDLGPMYATDRRQTASSLNAPAYGAGIIIFFYSAVR